MPEHEEQLMSIAARERKAEGYAEGYIEGFVEGYAEGYAEGRIEGRIEVLLRILQRRFGPLPQATCEKVRTGSPAEIEVWIDRAIDAKTLDAVLNSAH